MGREPKKPPLPYFAVALRLQILQTGSKVTALADAVGVGRQAVYNWMDGVNAPSTENLTAIAEFFGVGTDDLTGLNMKPAAREKNRRFQERLLRLIEAAGDDQLDKAMRELEKRFKVDPPDDS